jgi:hypothetical protein
MNNTNPNPTQNKESFIKRFIPDSQPFGNPMIYLSIIIMLILIVITILVIYTEAKKVELKDTTHAVNIKLESGNIFLIVLGGLIIVSMTIIYFRFPEFYHNIMVALYNSYYLFFLLLYIIFIIVLYQNILTPEQITEYSYFILPITVIIGIIIFYLNISSTISNFLSINATADRVKYSIIYFCLIVVLILFYYINPNDYISQYVGPYLVVSILIAVFGFLYLMTLMSFPAKGTANSSSVLSRFNPFTVFSVISFIIFLVLVTSGILYFPGGFKNSSRGTQSSIILLILIVCLSWIASFVLSLFRGETNSTPSANESSVFSFYGNIFRNVLLLVLGITFSGILIYWLVTGTQLITSKSGIASFILNLIIILVILGLIFRILSGTSFYKNSAVLRLIVNTVLYIPCLFVSFVDGLAYVFGIVKKFSPSINLTNLTNLSLGSTATNENTTIYFVYLGIIVLAIIGYLIYPYVEEKVTDQGGTLLINQPVYLNNVTNLASYQTLNKIKEIDMGNEMNPMQFNYNYAISFWAFFDSENPSKTNQYTSILNYGNKPNILFNPMDNTLIFVSNKADASAINNFTLSQLEENGNQVLYEHKNVLLQKWNHIIVNYNGGTLDIFINGKLKKSVIGVIPYKTLDTLQVGSENGIQGGICNLNYFDNVLNMQQIYYLYNLLKDKTPPVHSSSQDTIINIMEQVPNIVNNNPIEISSNETYSKNLDAAINDATSTISAGVKEIATINDARYIPKNNYLSWDWYFKNNKY